MFESALQERLAKQAPLAERLRPRTLDEVIGQEHLIGKGRPLRALIETDRLGSTIFWGPPGTGKTTLARVIATETKRHFVPLSAVTAGVKDVRDTVAAARRRLAEHDEGTILFLDEVHRFNKSQQDALLPSVEDGTLTLIGATTENPFFEVNAPLMSRSTLFRLEPLNVENLRKVLGRGLEAVGHSITDEGAAHLIDAVDGDARAVLTSLEISAAVAAQRGEGEQITLEDVEAARSSRAIRWSEDEHYDVISAFIKSIRGSDPDAGLYWLARMLAAGEDARFIARRLVILASEDIAMADPIALVVANAAAQAVEFVGLPEAQLNLAHAVVHLATSPKSNRTTVALGKAQADVAERPAGPVPPHLRSAHPHQKRRTGEGTGYVYPHDDPRGWVPQEHRPPEVAGRRYYEPSEHGREAQVAERLRRLTADPEDPPQ
ncbi:MAG: replication-associated recombination protein A [Actinobacteria bacterium]|nr:replication-associated recombination protein A [Actinomycetota bacterium]